MRFWTISTFDIRQLSQHEICEANDCINLWASKWGITLECMPIIYIGFLIVPLQKKCMQLCSVAWYILGTYHFWNMTLHEVNIDSFVIHILYQINIHCCRGNNVSLILYYFLCGQFKSFNNLPRRFVPVLSDTIWPDLTAAAETGGPTPPTECPTHHGPPGDWGPTPALECCAQFAKEKASQTPWHDYCQCQWN